MEGDIGVISKAYFESLPGSTFEEKSEAFVKAPIGTGPWKFAKRSVGTDIDFEANLDSWDAKRLPQFARLRIIKVPEVSTRMNRLRIGFMFDVIIASSITTETVFVWPGVAVVGPLGSAGAGGSVELEGAGRRGPGQGRRRLDVQDHRRRSAGPLWWSLP